MMSELFLVGALALQPASTHQPLNKAEQALFSMLEAYAPPEKGLMYMHKGFTYHDLAETMANLAPMGWLFVALEGRDNIHRLLLSRGYQSFPIWWREYAIYRKPIMESV